MKKKILKILALAVALVLIAGLGFFANAFLGNPVSKMMARSTAKKHLNETYAGTDYYIDSVYYDFKSSCYHALIKSPSSMDTYFSLRISMLGKLGYDSYEDVTSKTTTARRLENEYRELADTVFNDPSFPYTCDISYGMMEIYPIKYHGNDDVPSYALNQDELVLDKIYDIRELGRKAGHLIIYVDSDTVTVEEAARIMLDIKSIFDKSAVPFAAVDFTLQHPKPLEGPRDDIFIGTNDFLYEDIYEDGMAERVDAADKALKEYYAEQDAKMEAEMDKDKT